MAAGYEAELHRIEEEICAHGGADALAMPIDAQRVTHYIYCLYQRASIAGNLTQLRAVERVIERTMPLLTHPGDLYLLKANAAFKRHRLADVEAALAAVPSLAECNEGRLLRADLDFQRGRYQEARTGYAVALQAERSWSALARLAYFQSKMGDLAGADRLYREAQDELTAKEMRSYAWLAVQRGFLAFAHGRHEQAQSHYDRADAAYPGYWLVDEHRAELLGAEGRYREAIDILRQIVAANDRPDLQQAIGELYESDGRRNRARCSLEQAVSGYRQSVRDGEVHYYHHLADYFSDAATDGTEAVRWARADWQLRENYSTQAALAWAHYRNGELGEACLWIDRALASGAAEAHLFFRAAQIFSAAGESTASQNHLERARRLNPAVDGFHIHH
jgi:tetratricopeptide (TPR) repeat protein